MKITQFLYRVLLATIQIFLLQILLWNLFYMIFNSKIEIESILSEILYIFFYYFIFYYLLMLIASFTFWKFRVLNSWLFGQIFALIGYCAFRFGDILDGDFIKNFTISELLSFIVLGILIKIIIEISVLNKLNHKMGFN